MCVCICSQEVCVCITKAHDTATDRLANGMKLSSCGYPSLSSGYHSLFRIRKSQQRSALRVYLNDVSSFLQCGDHDGLAKLNI